MMMSEEDREYEADIKSGARREIVFDAKLKCTLQYFAKSPSMPKDAVIVSFYGVGVNSSFPGFIVGMKPEDFERYKTLIGKFSPPGVSK